MTLHTGHIGLNVTDLDRSLAFYRDVLEFSVIAEGKEEDRRYAFLGDGESLVLTLWQQAGQPYDTGRAGLHHLAFEAASIEQVRHPMSFGVKRPGCGRGVTRRSLRRRGFGF
ncbi:hypothetical protein SNL152K_6701 [Streptomyces sp. NL15-2K]|nr:VOC family protein [Kutzneria buriramensis]WKX09129.1 VOC family protein [Kutzneria buriramensis]GCB49366.1 hypothetical protein SNL152K_6701 [Streptomyces sp. NL15-2K]